MLALKCWYGTGKNFESWHRLHRLEFLVHFPLFLNICKLSNPLEIRWKATISFLSCEPVVFQRNRSVPLSIEKKEIFLCNFIPLVSSSQPTYAGLLSQREAAVAEFHMDDRGLRGPTQKYEPSSVVFPSSFMYFFFSAFGDFRCEAEPTEPWTVTGQGCNRPAVRYNSHTHAFIHVSICAPL